MVPDERRPLILMLDDDQDFRSIVKGWLSPRYEFVGLENGEGMLGMLEGVEPELILLDVRMPGPDGFRLCRRIRADGRFADIPILFLTACKEDEDFVRHLDAGGTAYLSKPVSRGRLLAVIRELLPRAAAGRPGGGR